jgi:hypothetical protein
MPEASTAVREESLFSFNHILAGPGIGQRLNPAKYKEEHLRPATSYPDLPVAYLLKGRHEADPRRQGVCLFELCVCGKYLTPSPDLILRYS